MTPVVRTRLGALRGFEDDGVHVYRGIPYAEPPIGPLRFAGPEPPQPWSGERDATAFGAAPPQPVDGLSVTLGLLGADLETSEDCLTLNVHVPADAAKDGRPRAVMVWLHGGAFQTGAASGPVYDGRALARIGDVVLVTLNYRVGALGFLQLGAQVPANRGLLDQIAALRFVRQEIHAFGGDPNRVTVFGESAGAGSLCALLAIPAAAGLFHGAIVQSAAPKGHLDTNEAHERAKIFFDQLGLRQPTLDGLRSVSSAEILTAQTGCAEPGPRRIGMFFAPVVDGAILPAPPLEAVAGGSARNVRMMVMTTAQEMQLYHLLPGFPALSDEQLHGYVISRLPADLENPARHATAILATYADQELDPLDRFFAVETDASLWVPATELAESQARHQSDTWMARFAWPSPMLGGRLGACHALDIAFTLGNQQLEGVRAFAGEGAGADALAAHLTGAWTRFAKTGDPNGGDLLAWPRYEPTQRSTLEFDEVPQCLDLPLEERRRAWRAEP